MVVTRSANLSMHWEYPAYIGVAILQSSMLNVSINYWPPSDSEPSTYIRIFKEIRYLFHMGDWYFSFEKQEGDGDEPVIISLTVNKDEPSIYDQQFAIMYEGPSTDEFLASVLEVSKKC